MSLEDLIKQTEQKFILDLEQQFPGIKSYTGRWNKKVYCSKSVNKFVDQFEHRHNCGCCSDSPLEVWPYIEIDGNKIYSDPPCLTVGEAFHYGDIPNKNWKQILQKYEISDVIIDKVQKFFEECKQSARHQVEEEIENLKKYLVSLDDMFDV